MRMTFSRRSSSQYGFNFTNYTPNLPFHVVSIKQQLTSNLTFFGQDQMRLRLNKKLSKPKLTEDENLKLPVPKFPFSFTTSVICTRPHYRRYIKAVVNMVYEKTVGKWLKLVNVYKTT